MSKKSLITLIRRDGRDFLTIDITNGSTLSNALTINNWSIEYVFVERDPPILTT
jgi:hypothetical protein